MVEMVLKGVDVLKTAVNDHLDGAFHLMTGVHQRLLPQFCFEEFEDVATHMRKGLHIILAVHSRHGAYHPSSIIIFSISATSGT